MKQSKAVDYRAAGEVAIHLGVEVWRHKMDTLNEIFLACVNEELNISVAFQMAYDLGKADAQRELAEELTGGSSILRDPAGDVSKEGEQ